MPLNREDVRCVFYRQTPVSSPDSQTCVL